MKKILLSVALLCAAVTMRAEWMRVVERDTVMWTREIRTEQTYKVNEFGEKRTQRKAVLVVNDADKEKVRKVTINKATYEALLNGAQAYVVFATYEDGSEKIIKVLTK